MVLPAGMPLHGLSGAATKGFRSNPCKNIARLPFARVVGGELDDIAFGIDEIRDWMAP